MKVEEFLKHDMTVAQYRQLNQKREALKSALEQYGKTPIAIIRKVAIICESVDPDFNVTPPELQEFADSVARVASKHVREIEQQMEAL
jgi:hypothetical protein